MTCSQKQKKKFGRFFARNSRSYRGQFKTFALGVRKKDKRDQFYQPYANQIIIKASKSSVSKKACIRNRAIRRLRASLQTFENQFLKNIQKNYQIMLIANEKTPYAPWECICEDLNKTLQSLKK